MLVSFQAVAAYTVNDDGTVLTGDSSLQERDKAYEDLSKFKEVRVDVNGKPAYNAYSNRIDASGTDFYLTVNSTDGAGNHDAIKLNNHGPWMNVKDLYITVTAYKSDGVNVTWDSHDADEGKNTPHVSARNAYITINALDGNGYGLRANSSKQATAKSYIDINQDAIIDMNNGGTAIFAGISRSDTYYDDELDEGESEKRCLIGNLFCRTYTGSGYAAEVSVSGDTRITLGKNGFAGTISSFQDASLYARYQGTIHVNNLIIQSYGSGRRDVYGILAGERSKNENKQHYQPNVIVDGNVDIDMTLGEKGRGEIYALKAIEGDISVNKEWHADYVRIKGNIDNEDGKIEVNFANSSSNLIGAATSGDHATTSFSFKDGASWIISGNSNISELSLDNGNISFDKALVYGSNAQTKTDNSEYWKLSTGSLTGSGTITSRVDLALDTSSTLANDQIEADTVNGTFTGRIVFNGVAPSLSKLYTSNWLFSQGDGSMTIHDPTGGNSYSANGSIVSWSLKFVPESIDISSLTKEELENLGNTGQGNGKWYLVQTGVELEKPDLPPEVAQIENLGSSVAQAVGWLSEKNDLRRRLGEVRYGTRTGAWVKAFNRQDRAQGFRYSGFKQESSGIHVGYDTLISQTDSYDWIVGATLRYAHSTQEGLETAYGGDGRLDEYSAKVYASWIHNNGSYLDLIAQVGYYNQEIIGTNNESTGSFDANYHNIGYGMSAEVGHMFTLWDSGKGHWIDHVFFEPELELSYFYVKGESFKTSTGLKVDQGNADFLTGRLGFVLGKKVNYGSSEDFRKRWYQVGLIGGINHEFLGDQTIRFTGIDGGSAKVKGHGLGGTSFYYGITADWQVSDNLRVYGELDREEGEHYTKDYGVNIGLKYAF